MATFMDIVMFIVYAVTLQHPKVHVGRGRQSKARIGVKKKHVREDEKR